MRTFATPDRYNQTAFSLDVAVNSMELYQDLFNVSYPLPKQGIRTITVESFIFVGVNFSGLSKFVSWVSDC